MCHNLNSIEVFNQLIKYVCTGIVSLTTVWFGTFSFELLGSKKGLKKDYTDISHVCLKDSQDVR